jgi:regulator of sigma E protease
MVIVILSAIVVLGVLIFVHELGHFIVAKRKGVGVKKFSLGFGPTLVGKKVGETEYVISAVPFGGYVKMVGEVPDAEIAREDIPGSFPHQSLPRRAAVVVAGPLSNFLFAVFLFFLIFMLGFPVLTATVGEVKEGFPADQAGLQAGDAIIELDGKPVNNWEEMALMIRESTRARMMLKVNRGGQLLDIKVEPRIDEASTPFGEKKKVRVIGITPAGDFKKERTLNPFLALYRGLKRTVSLTALIILGIVKLIQGVVPASELGGPLLIAQLAGESARAGLVALLHFMAFLSINLAILNLLPIPVLDGGHLMFFAVEGIYRRPLSVKKKELAQQVGFFIIMLLMVFVFYNDISRIFAKWFQD